MVLPTAVKENSSVKTIKVLGDKKLMPRAARKRLGSSLSGKQLNEYIQDMKREGFSGRDDKDSDSPVKDMPLS